jgi:hypothetical protein
MGTFVVQMKGVHPLLVRWTHRPGTRDFFIMAALGSPVQDIFPHHTLIHFMCSAQQHRLAGVPGRLSLIMCL